MAQNDYETMQKLKEEITKLNERNKVLYEYILTQADEDAHMKIIPAQYLSENYRIEITGVANNTGYMTLRANAINNCNSGLIALENNEVTSNSFNNQVGCVFAKVKSVYLCAVIEVRYNAIYNGYHFSSEFSNVSPGNNINMSGTAWGNEYNTGKNYDLVLGLHLRAGAKIRIIKQP